MSRPVRLSKDDGHNSFSFKVMDRIEAWAIAHATILLPLGIIIALIIFLSLCYMICGASATDSGLQYNHLKDVI